MHLENVKKTIWLTRPDLRELCGDDWERFEWWLFVNGAREYRAIAEARPVLSDAELVEPAAEAIAGTRPMLTRSLVHLWRVRPDLQSSFNLSTADGQLSLSWWLITEGARESEALLQLAVAVCQHYLSKPAECAFASVEPPLTDLMLFIWAKRQDLWDVFDLETSEGQQKFVGWYFLYGVKELGFARYVTAAQRQMLNEPDTKMPGGGIPITRLMVLIWQQRPDLQQAFSLTDLPGRSAFLEWFSTHGAVEMQLAELGAGPSASASEIGSKRPASMASSPAIEAAAICRSDGTRPFGVNLIGYARGQFGIGEDVRTAAFSMKAAGIPFSVYNIDPGKEVSQEDDSVDAMVSRTLPYSINLMCTTGFETARLAATEGAHLFANRRIIGYWPWELAEWPKEWYHAYDLVDEIWASSRYVYHAYVKTSPKLVRHMAMAVVADASAGLERRDFGLASGSFLFVFSFDMLSSLARKNPQACLRAFKMAFPKGNERVGLVIKVMHIASGNPAWHEFILEAQTDPRVTIIGGTLSRGATLDLVRACDCYVSLHRAEGFGRGIAEAMMLGKPVIVTGYSGNLDYTTPGNSALIDYKLLSVSPEDYVFADGQVWADPDLSHAAWWMHRLVEDDRLRTRLANQGQALTNATYLPRSVGEQYSAVLGH